MSTIIIISPPQVASKDLAISEATDGSAQVMQEGAILFTCSSKDEAIAWLQHAKHHPIGAPEPE